MAFEKFMEPDNLVRLLRRSRTEPHDYLTQLSEWCKRIGPAAGAGGIDSLARIVRDVAPMYVEGSEHQMAELEPLERVMKLKPEDRVWIVDDLLYAGGFSILSADPKAGKSTLSRWLAACVLAGRDFLGRGVQKGSVLYYCLEEPDHEFAGSFQPFARHLGIGWPDLEGSMVSFYRKSYGDVVERLEEHIEEYKPTLVVLDTLFRFLGVQGENEYGHIVQELDRLRRVTQRQGSWAKEHTHILALHHSRKLGGGGGDPYKAMVGSVGIRGATDVNMLITVTKDEKRLLHKTEGRTRRPLPPLFLVLRDDHMDWVYAPSDHEERGTKRVEEALEFIEKNPGRSRVVVQEHLKGKSLGLSAGKWKSFWDGLVEDGVLVDDKGLRVVLKGD